VYVGAYPVLDQPPTGPDTTMDETRSLSLRALDGTNPFPSTGREFFFMPDIEGIDYPDPEIITKRIPGEDGERLQEIRIGPRDIFLPLWIASDSSHLDYLARRDALAALFSHFGVDYRANDGTFDLVANSPRGERTLRVAYKAGMSRAKWPNEGATWAKLGINLIAVRPFWYGERWETPVLKQPAAVNSFASFPLQFSTSVALGENIPVIVGGDASSWAEMTFVGPADTINVSSTGLQFSIPAGLADGETAQIITDSRGRTALFDGVKDWSRVGPVRKWSPLAPGDRRITIAITGTGTNTEAQVSGWSRYLRWC
jgi:hypothetical protein